ncbi:hypothetical protein BH18ACI3_BH18ACI3_21480 [soil metagenome]
MAAFALGEIESIAGADAILRALNEQKAETRPVGSVSHAQDHTLANTRVSTRLVEAAGKIAAANPKDPKSKDLGEAILDTREAEDRRGAKQSRDVVLIGLTAALRAKPDETNIVVAKFLTNLDARVRADAANTLSRVKAKNANEALRSMLLSDSDAVARANAARALGAAEDKMAFDLILEAATGDDDLRVRVSAIRSLSSLKEEKAADALIERGKNLLKKYHASQLKNPEEQSELLEIAATLGRLIPSSKNIEAKAFLMELRDSGWNPEADVAYARVAPESYLSYVFDSLRIRIDKKRPLNWREVSNAAQALTELIKSKNNGGEALYKEYNIEVLEVFIPGKDKHGTDYSGISAQILPDILRTYAELNRSDVTDVMRTSLRQNDVFVRAAAAELLGHQPISKENVEALRTAFARSLQTDKLENDAQFAILSALVKLDKQGSANSLKLALEASDFLLRRHAASLIRDNNLANDFPEFENKTAPVRPYDPKTGTKLGQVLNTDADYRRAISRKNGSVKAVMTTQKGTFTIDFLPEDAPLTVDNFVKLAKSGYFNGLEVHRVVPNFVMQDGDPRGDGNGGPGWSIRCEVNMVPYERGAVGMALSGKDTGGSQWFVTHSPQPHLDGGYTVFGRVNETGMKIVDNIVRGDKIISVKVIEGNLPQKGTRGRKR